MERGLLSFKYEEEKRYIHPRRIQGPDRGIVIHFRLK